MTVPTEAIILAGGLGQRLRAVVSDVPKPLAPVAGRPFLAWLLEGLAAQGLRRVVLATGYMAATVRERIGDRFAGLEVRYSEETAPLGTGGALWSALRLCSGDRVFALNGDTWLGSDLAILADAAPGSDLTLAARPVEDRSRYGGVLAEGDRFLGLSEKGLAGPGLISAGQYVLRRDLPGRLALSGAFSFETEILARPHGLDLRVHATAAPFIDIGTPDDYARAQALIPRWAARPGAGAPADGERVGA